MKIALVVERFELEGGASEHSAMQIARELLRRGHQITILAGWSPPDLEMEGMFIQRCPVGRLKTSMDLRGYSNWVKRTLDQTPFDVSLSFTMAAPAMVLQPLNGTVRETLDRNIALRSKPAHRAVKRWLLSLSLKQRMLLRLEHKTLSDPMVRRIAAVSHYVAKQLRNHYDFPPELIQIIPNATEVPVVTHEQKLIWRQQIRQGFNIPDMQPVFLFAAANPKLSGFLPMMRAARQLKRWSLPFTLLLAGNMGYEHQRMTVRYGIRDYTRIIGLTDRMHELYCAADITVLPTYYDPSSKVVTESLMLGTPAITTLYNGASDFIINSVGHPRGMVVAEPDDVEAISQAMADLSKPENLQRCRDATIGLADAFSMQRHVDHLEALFEMAMRE